VRHVTSDSVTIPGDTTIVVGGIKVDAKSSTVSKIPLLGDIPLIGNLFKDQSKNSSTTRLYVFITPRILRDPHFQDIRLLTQGPLAEAGLATDIPPLEPVIMDMVEPKRLGLPARRPAEPNSGAASGTPEAMAPSQLPIQEGTAN
jgi:type II secretory pathway component GspD/PulD (secretin)